MDYCFFHGTGLEKHEEEPCGSMPIFVVYDELKERLGHYMLTSRARRRTWSSGAAIHSDVGYAGNSVSVKADQETARF